MENRIEYLEDKLIDLRVRWKTSSPSMRKFIETGAKLIKNEIETIKRKMENKDQVRII